MKKRFAWLLIPALFVVVVGLAFLLSPKPQGYGSHQALGLPPCLFLEASGKPCPSCGLTTSFCQLVRGDLKKSFLAHPLGPLLFIMFALISGLALLEFFNIKTCLQGFSQGKYKWFIFLALALYLAVWVWRLN